MYTVDLYLRVRLACHVDGLSQREAASRFGIARETVRKMLRHSEGAYILSLTGRFAGCRGPVLVAMWSPKSSFSGHGPLCYVRID